MGGKIKFEYGGIVLSVSKMAIFRNRPDIFNILFGHDKNNFVFFVVISVCLKSRAIIYSKTRFFEGVFLTKCRHFSLAEFHRSHRLRRNYEF